MARLQSGKEICIRAVGEMQRAVDMAAPVEVRSTRARRDDARQVCSVCKQVGHSKSRCDAAKRTNAYDCRRACQSGSGPILLRILCQWLMQSQRRSMSMAVAAKLLLVALAAAAVAAAALT
eukprot:6189131-Pleurochrysis_carterae.AAC.1